ncbi:hypothetical protein EDF56_101165 [Novosphingobium sp. PhB165]|uniref:hypothetical protein n=1 Tax=Novosphingobium sp. PhB165 TaxID=2485105 RepID=UPI00104D09B7|nr:hypothetical protein [Novosphingobium sp. PhB165]TCM21501.1 hypothetical protein EDF56_101165 [Novosphingobium sp. PhB165]
MSVPAPFEVVPVDGGFSWRLIGSCGRALVYPQETYPSDFAAADAAKVARADLHARALLIDGGAHL